MRAGSINTNSFTAVVNFLSDEVNHKNIRRKQLKTSNNRTISKVQTGKDGSKHTKDKSKSKEWKKLGPVPFAMVDGKRVEGRKYSNKEFLAFNKNQRNKIVELKRQRWSSGDGTASVSGVSVSSGIKRDDLISVGDAIIAGVSRASTEVSEETASSGGTSVASSKRTATSGGIGDFLARSKRSRGADDA